MIWPPLVVLFCSHLHLSRKKHTTSRGLFQHKIPAKKLRTYPRGLLFARTDIWHSGLRSCLIYLVIIVAQCLNNTTIAHSGSGRRNLDNRATITAATAITRNIRFTLPIEVLVEV